MSPLVALDKISLKDNPNIKEDLIQSYIFNDPSVLGLGDLTPIQREKKLSGGGRIDMLLTDDNGNRYEVEVQLGKTDPSHIIRTIEYWDTERKRYPQYDHCAVIIAEEITGRFMNVISLFNGAIPLIALQLSAYKVGNNIALTFTKVVERVTLATDDEDDYEVTDRNYWEKRSTPKMLKAVDEIFRSISVYAPNYEFKYNKFYIGLSKDGIAKNFVSFKPKKNYLYLCVKGNEDIEKAQAIEKAGLDIVYDSRWKQYKIRLNDFADYQANKEQLDALIKTAMTYYNIEEE